MKLVFYGGGDEEDNYLLNEKLLSLVSNEKPLITYIPSWSYDSDNDFAEFVKNFQPFGVNRIIKFPIDRGVDPYLLQIMFQSDIVHLAGGNTYYFLKYLRKAKMLPLLKKFVKRGGILTGLSAGAILMTPRIDTAGFPSFDKDDNDENVRNLNSLGLVPFYFFPHYKNSKRYDADLLKYSKKVSQPIYAAPDGCGIIINDTDITFHGRIFGFHKNIKFQLRK